MRDDFQGWAYCMTVEAWANHPQSVSEFTHLCQLAGVSKGSKVLDVGCNTGNSFTVINALGAEPFGTEPNVSARVRAAEVYGRTLHASTLDFQTSFWGTKGNAGFDVVLANHVLGHADFPRDLLNEMRRVVRKPGGVIGVVVPNPIYDRKMRLLNWFTGYKGDRTLKRLVRPSYVFLWGHTAFAKSKVSQHYFGDPPRWVPNKWCPDTWRSRVAVVIRIEEP